MLTTDSTDDRKPKVRVNVTNPEFPQNSDQPRVIAVVDDDGTTAHTASGLSVPITDTNGLLLDDVRFPQ